jgi:hypothetical protein
VRGQHQTLLLQLLLLLLPITQPHCSAHLYMPPWREGQQTLLLQLLLLLLLLLFLLHSHIAMLRKPVHSLA